MEVISVAVEKVGTAFLSKSKKGVVIRIYGEGGSPDEYYFTSVQSVNDLLKGDKPYINVCKGDERDEPQ